MSGSFDDQGRLIIGDGLIVTVFGKKRSGKSALGLVLHASYPRDSIVIAANMDDGPFPDGERVHLVEGNVESLPRRWPEDLRPEPNVPIVLRIQVDPGSPTFLEDQDAAVGLALTHGDCAVLVHEVGLLAPSNRVPPHTKRLLHANRHRGVTAILCGPRPITVDPLVIAQSDLVYLFEMQVKADRQRAAETMGWDEDDLAAALEDLGRFEYLRFDAQELKPAAGEQDIRVVHLPPLPEELVKRVSAKPGERPGH
jgi:hypothetical protein